MNQLLGFGPGLAGTVDAKAVLRRCGRNGGLNNGGATAVEVQGLAAQVVVSKYPGKTLTVAKVDAVGAIIAAKG